MAPLRQVEEQSTFHIAVVQDITERRRAEQNLTTCNATLEQEVSRRTQEGVESRQRLQAILDGTSDTVFVKDIEGRSLLLNHAAGRCVGTVQEEVIGHDNRVIFSAADTQAMMAADRKIITSGATMTYEDSATTADGGKDHSFRPKDLSWTTKVV
ncbi:hypothetical protein COMA1_11538 [Candidatus Nitrospira nitrosa]|uniref:PAS domain-containing protein n=1 Tax=Candidatus Nitrospira nitrosa TaxID=1742972 RepID=A0A0S4L8X3_9BACT|nr:PAS domain S-box protein [Candidatus Nitrospira nitrosa]CUS34135.1 hypothetical protein COMA1_11538 [Candidatus Nitrospira nitrosa]